MKKWFKYFTIIVLLTSVFFSISTKAFCNDDLNSVEKHHGIVLCHASCCHATVPSGNYPSVMAPDASSLNIFTPDLSYSNPSLDTSKRPPIVLS